MIEPSLQSRLTRIGRAFSSEESAARVQRGYLEELGSAKRILDVGCGTGVFLDLVREAGREPVGIDADASAADQARARGHSVEVDDAERAVRRLVASGQEFDGAVLSQVIEHMAPAAVLSLLDALAELLCPGARLVIATPNPRNLVVLSEVFWLDPTHLRPYPRALTERLGAEAGFRVRRSYDDPLSRPVRAGWKRVLAGLRSRLSGADRSGPMDSIVVLER